MTREVRNRWLIVMTAILVLVVLCAFKQRTSYRCVSCCSTKGVYQWEIGGWRGLTLPLSPRWERETETHYRQDFLPTNHIHVWIFAQASPYYLLGTTWGGCAIGPGRHTTDLSYLYERSEEFRNYIRRRIQDRLLTASNFTMLMTNGIPEDPQLQVKSDGLIAGYFGRQPAK